MGTSSHLHRPPFRNVVNRLNSVPTRMCSRSSLLTALRKTRTIFHTPTQQQSHSLFELDEALARNFHNEELSKAPDRPVPDLRPNTRSRLRRTPPARNCVVCDDSVPIYEYPALPACAHKPQTCSRCYKAWLASSVASKPWNAIPCPEHGCKTLLQHPDVQLYAAPEVYEKFDRLSALSALNNEPDFRWCKAPGCSSGQIHATGIEGNIFTCASCGHKACTVHQGTWHEGETCKEYSYRTSGRQQADRAKQERASERRIKAMAKRCPGRGCGAAIEKIEGCDHMTCVQCRHEFCWKCLAPYGPISKLGNAHHKRDCPYHSSRIV